MDLNTVWFILFAVLIAGYAILDGFDLGVGILHLFTREDRARRINLNAIGPVWDGNEVWLLTGGGALFAAFPVVYATVFSGCYLALMLLLAALILRAVSLEFRSKVDAPGWKRFWDWSFGLGSLLPALLFGVAVGNILRGIPIDAQGNFTGTFLGLLNPYSLLVGLLSVAMCTMHGAAWLYGKSEGAHQEWARRWARGAWLAFLLLYAAALAWSVAAAPHLFATAWASPLCWLFAALFVVGVALFPGALAAGRWGRLFLASAAAIGAMLGLAAVGLFPRLVPSSLDLDWSLPIYNASSSQLTLTVMLVIALVGMPLVIGYTIFIYRAFRGKVVLTGDSY